MPLSSYPLCPSSYIIRRWYRWNPCSILPVLYRAVYQVQHVSIKQTNLFMLLSLKQVKWKTTAFSNQEQETTQAKYSYIVEQILLFFFLNISFWKYNKECINHLQIIFLEQQLCIAQLGVLCVSVGVFFSPSSVCFYGLCFVLCQACVLQVLHPPPLTGFTLKSQLFGLLKVVFRNH